MSSRTWPGQVVGLQATGLWLSCIWCLLWVRLVQRLELEQQSQAGLHLGAKSYREDSTMVLANTSAHMVEGGPQDGYCQCLRPQGELQLPSASERLHDQLVGLT